MRIDGGTSSIYSLRATLQATKSASASLGTSPAVAGPSTTEATTSDGVSTYDFTHMTPDQMKGVAQDLFKSGKIDLTQLFMLQNAGMPLGKVGANGEFVPLSESEKAKFGHTPVNYVETAQNAMAYLEQTGGASNPKSGYEAWKSILAILHNKQGTASGLNISV